MRDDAVLGRALPLDRGLGPVRIQSSYDYLCTAVLHICQQEVKVIWQKAPHGGPIPRLGVTPGGEICTIEFLG